MISGTFVYGLEWGTLRFPYSAPAVAAVKEIPGAKWDKVKRVWKLPTNAMPAMLTLLSPHMALQFVKEQINPPQANFPPKVLTAFRPYQLHGACALATYPGFILSFDLRTGKTITALGAASGLLMNHSIDAVLALYPSSVEGEWTRQPKQWVGLDMVALEGVKPFDAAAIEALRVKPYLLLGCSYELIGRRYKDILAIMNGRRFACIADEAQNAKNRKSGRFEALQAIATHPGALYRWATTGTSMRNRPADMWAIFEFIQPGSMGTFFQYAKRYCTPPSAPVWMGDYSFKPIGEIRAGDEVIGWARGPAPGRKSVGARDRDVLQRTRVIGVHRHEAEIVEVMMDSGRIVYCTPDHKWLSNASREIYSDTPRNVEIRKRFAAGEKIASIGASVGLASATVWNIATGASYKYMPAKVGRTMMHVVDTDNHHALDVRLAGWVAGMYDGEGHGAFISQSSVANPDTHAALGDALTRLGIEHSLRSDSASTVGGAQILGGRAGFFRFLRMVQPIRRAGWDRLLLQGKFKTPDKVVSIKPAGRSEVVSLETETGNYVVYGYGSKNCDAREGEHGWDYSGSSNEAELKSRFEMVSYTITRADAGVYLPPSERRTILCSMSKETAMLYRAQEQAHAVEIKRALSGGDNSASVGVLKKLAAATSAAKIPTAIERIKYHCEERRVKTLVFATFHESLKALWDVLEPDVGRLPLDVPVFCAGGWQLPDKRRKVIEQWKQTPGPAVLLANTLSSGIGIDLSDADVAIYLELCWVPADFVQSEGRIQDIHQGKRTSPPLYEYLLTKGTVDADMGLALIRKQNVINAVVGRDRESSAMVTALKESGAVDSSNLSLDREDPRAVEAALEALQRRLLGLDSEDQEMGSRMALAAAVGDAFSDPDDDADPEQDSSLGEGGASDE